MKNIKFLVTSLIIVAIGATSCKQSATTLTGTWTSTGEESVIVDAGTYTPFIQAFFSNGLFKMPTTLVFNEDKTGTATMADGTTVAFTYTNDGSNIVMNFDSYLAGYNDIDISSIPIVFSYSIVKKRLELSSDIKNHIKLFLSLSDIPSADLWSNSLNKVEIKGSYTK